MYRLLLIFTFAVTLLGYSCNDPLTIELPEKDDIEIIYSDTFSVNSKTIQGEISSTYDLGINYNTYLLGALDDPIFGKSTSDIYLELAFAGTLPNFKDASVDSTILIIEYSTDGFYGDTTATYNVEVRRMVEQMSGDSTLSTKTWDLDPTVIGSRSIIPNKFDSISINNHTVPGETIKVGPQLRIPMTMEFGQLLIDADSTNYVDSDALLEFINGLNVSATTSSSSMMGLNLSDVTNFSGNNKLRVYYNTPDGVLTPDSTKVFSFSFTSRTASTFVHDTQGTPLEDYLADEDFNNDDKAYFQGMSGVETQIDFPSVEELRDKIINKAQLTFYSVSDPTEVNVINTPVQLATLTYIDSNGDRTLTSDATFGINTGPYGTILGGVPELIDETNGIYKTTVNLTNHLHTVFSQEGVSPSVILTPLQRSERSSRTIIFGSGSDQYQPVLEITYTNL